MRRRLLVLLPVLALASGCAAPDLEALPGPWWDEADARAFAIGSGGGGLSPDRGLPSGDEREVSASVSLGGNPPGAYRAQAACDGPGEIEVVIGDTTTIVPCGQERWTAIDVELREQGPLRADVRNVMNGGGYWLVGFDPVDD